MSTKKSASPTTTNIIVFLLVRQDDIGDIGASCAPFIQSKAIGDELISDLCSVRGEDEFYSVSSVVLALAQFGSQGGLLTVT
jgi:hypothetical protein